MLPIKACSGVQGYRVHFQKSFTYREKSEEKRAEFAGKLNRIPKGKRVGLDESGALPNAKTPAYPVKEHLSPSL